MWPARVMKTASRGNLWSASTLLCTAESSMPLFRTTRRTTALPSAYAFASGLGRPGPATRLPLGTGAEPTEGAVGATAVPGGAVEGGTAATPAAGVVATGVVDVDDAPLEWCMRVRRKNPTTSASPPRIATC